MTSKKNINLDKALHYTQLILVTIVLSVIIFWQGFIFGGFISLSPENKTTVITWSLGILVAAIAYLAKNFVFQPKMEYKKTVGKIRNRLKYYAGDLGVTLGSRIRSCDNCNSSETFMVSDHEDVLEARRKYEDRQRENEDNIMAIRNRYKSISNDVRKLACDLEEAYYSVSFIKYSVICKILQMSNSKDLRDVVGYLIGISNGIMTDNILLEREVNIYELHSNYVNDIKMKLNIKD